MMMTSQGIQGNRSSTRQFLFYKTDGVCSDNKTSKKPPVGLKELNLKFPRMQKGKPFIDQAMVLLDASLKFAVMLIRIDEFTTKESVSGKNYAARLLVNVASAIDTVCKKNNGIWGLIERDLFGCFFQEKQESVCLKLADEIRTSFSAPRNETLTIGVALYPVAQFNRIQTLKNARKALDHAGFYGYGGTAIFDAMSLNISGDRLYQKGEVRKAIDEFKTALLLDPSNVNIHNSLGVCYGILGALQSALEEFETAARLNSSDVMSLYNAGLIYIRLEDTEKAIKYLLKAYKNDPNVFEVAFQTGLLYLQKKKFEKATEFFEKALKLQPESGMAFRYLGESYTALNQLEKAILAYKKAIRHNPDDAAAISALGCLFDRQGENPDIAILFCRHSIEIASENGLFHQRLGKLYLKQDWLEDALKEFEQATKLGCDSVEYIEQIHIRQHKAS